nr:hypothetical protein [Cressdnaviricota sp.]
MMFTYIIQSNLFSIFLGSLNGILEYFKVVALPGRCASSCISKFFKVTILLTILYRSRNVAGDSKMSLTTHLYHLSHRFTSIQTDEPLEVWCTVLSNLAAENYILNQPVESSDQATETGYILCRVIVEGETPTPGLRHREQRQRQNIK